MKKFKCLVTRQVYFKNSHIDIFENTVETNEELVSLYKGFYRELPDTEEVKPVIEPDAVLTKMGIIDDKTDNTYKVFVGDEIVDTIPKAPPVINPEDNEDDGEDEETVVAPPKAPEAVTKKEEKKKEPVVNPPEPDKRRGRPSAKK